MALSREPIILDIIQLISELYGIGLVRRNPETPPKEEDFPAVNVFERTDTVTDRGQGPRARNKRDWRIIIEMFIAGTSEDLASSELSDFVQDIKDILFETDVSEMTDLQKSLNQKCALKEEQLSDIVSVFGGVKGCAMTVLIRYHEQL